MKQYKAMHGHIYTRVHTHMPHLKPAVQERPVDSNRNPPRARPPEVVPIVRARLHGLGSQVQGCLRILAFLVGQVCRAYMCLLRQAGAHGGFLLSGHGVEELGRMVLAVRGHANVVFTTIIRRGKR